LAWDHLATPLQFTDVVRLGASDKVTLGVSPSGDRGRQPIEYGHCLKRQTHREMGSVEERAGESLGALVEAIEVGEQSRVSERKLL
jgi:hypothetical protein